MADYKNKSSVYQDDYHIKQRIEEDYRNYNQANISFQAEATLDLKYYAGDQYSWNSLYASDDMSRKFVFNLIRKFVEMPAGYQMQHRKSLTAAPRENGDQMTADQFSKIFSWVETNGDLQAIVSDAFTFGTLVTGLNLVEMYMDYTQDPVCGDIKFDRIGHSAIMIDPYFKKHDLSDCSSIHKRSYVTKQQAMALLPDYKKEIQGMSGTTDRDGKFQYMAENYNFDVNKLLSYDEYYYMDTREQRVVLDRNTGQQIEWVGSKDALRYVLQQDPNLETYMQTIPSVKQAILLQDRLFYEGGCLLGIDSYPFIPFLGYYAPDLRDSKFRMQGLVRNIRDPQFLFNRRQVISLDVLESRTTSGYIAVADSVVDPDALYKTGQGQVIWRKKGTTPDDVQPITPPDISPGMAKMTEDMSELIKMITGIPEEALGQASDDIPGVLAMMRQGAALTVIQRLFNNADRSLNLIGKKIIEVVQNNFTPSKVERIIEQQPTQEFYNKTFGKYDVVVEEGFNTSTQRQQEFAELMQIKQLGLQFPGLDEALLETATIQNKTKLIESLQQQQQQQQQQQEMQMQMQMQEQQAGIKMAEARAQADQGLGMERVSRIQENQQLAVERQAEAQKDREQALLNKAKTLKELQEVDLRQVEQIIKIAKMLQEEEQVNEEDEGFDLAQRLSQINKMSEAAQPPASYLQ